MRRCGVGIDIGGRDQVLELFEETSVIPRAGIQRATLYPTFRLYAKSKSALYIPPARRPVKAAHFTPKTLPPQASIPPTSSMHTDVISALALAQKSCYLA
jgi:hypothetical protein